MATRYWSPTWDDIHRDSKALAASLGRAGRFETILAIARGGLIPAAILGYELGVRKIETISVVTYDNETMGQPRIVSPPRIDNDGVGCLIVDDLADTGTTARLVRSLLPRAHFACLYAKPAGKPIADSFVSEVEQDVWVVFPWDTEALAAQS